MAEEIEVVDVGSPIQSCVYNNTNDLTSGMVGFTESSTFIVCGPNSAGTQCKFIELTHTNSIWKVANFSMLEDRSYATILALDTTQFWITGGKTSSDDPDKNSAILKTTEIFKNGHFTFGQDLPHPTFSHCMAKINSTHIVTTGGKNTAINVLNKIHIINLNSNTNWTELPNMYSIRFGHSCGVAKNRLIVAGGLNMDTTEIFSFDRMEW